MPNSNSAENEKFAITAGCCLTGFASTLILPSSLSIPVVHATLEFGIDTNPKHIFNDPDGAMALLKSDGNRLDSIKIGESYDANRALLAAGLLFIIEAPLAVPQLSQHLAEFSRNIPDLVPASLAIGAFIYGLSWLNLRRQHKVLETKLSQELSKNN